MANRRHKETGSTRKESMKVKRKHEAVKRVDRGETIEMVARSIDVTADDVSRWREKADNPALGALKSNQHNRAMRRIWKSRAFVPRWANSP